MEHSDRKIMITIRDIAILYGESEDQLRIRLDEAEKRLTDSKFKSEVIKDRSGKEKEYQIDWVYEVLD
jgi:hypothetical protein